MFVVKRNEVFKTFSQYCKWTEDGISKEAVVFSYVINVWNLEIFLYLLRFRLVTFDASRFSVLLFFLFSWISIAFRIFLTVINLSSGVILNISNFFVRLIDIEIFLKGPLATNIFCNPILLIARIFDVFCVLLSFIVHANVLKKKVFLFSCVSCSGLVGAMASNFRNSKALANLSAISAYMTITRSMFEEQAPLLEKSKENSH